MIVKRNVFGIDGSKFVLGMVFYFNHVAFVFCRDPQGCLAIFFSSCFCIIYDYTIKGAIDKKIEI